MKAIMNLNKLKNTDELQQFHHRALKKSQKGIVIRFLLQVTGYSRQQLTRLIHQYQSTGAIQQKTPPKSQGFERCYTENDSPLQ